MFLSTFDIFKIGIGPSSSHTSGPMVAAGLFLAKTATISHGFGSRVMVRLHGSLALTGRGHATDRAVFFGLLGEQPDRFDAAHAEAALARLYSTKVLPGSRIVFDPSQDLVFDFGPPLQGHANGLVFTLFDSDGATVLTETYYSIGGGFVKTAGELVAQSSEDVAPKVPYPFKSGAQMLAMGRASGLTIAEMKKFNELTLLSEADLDARLDHLWDRMLACMARGLGQSGILPGGLNVRRRAPDLYEKLQSEHSSNAYQPHRAMDWLSLYALAVNEENATGGQIVTAPTNGAAGVVPAVIRYYLEHCAGADRDGLHRFLLTAAAIGGLIKHNASISGAEVGCQGEVGTASAMAAAGLCAALAGSNEQVENAAEIALEHHLGMTCDPIAGLVQIPCIERNAFGAVKAVTAASLALHGDGVHLVSLDACVETMRQTGRDMASQYKETSTGGLAVNVVAC